MTKYLRRELGKAKGITVREERIKSSHWIKVACLLVTSCCLGEGLSTIGLPAAWMIGPMLGAVICALLSKGDNIAIPSLMFQTAQGLVGMVIASSFQPSIVPLLISKWSEVVVVGIGTLLISLSVGVLMSYIQKTDLVTSILGNLPGGASGMVAMSESVCADIKLVAVTQYVRLMAVVLSAAVGARVFASSFHVTHTGMHIQTSISWGQCILTIGIMGFGMWLGGMLKLPASALLGPMVLGILFESFGLVHIQLPYGAPSVAYAVIGIYVGLLFDKAAVKHAGALLPYFLLSSVILIASCAGMGLLLKNVSGEDFVTCFLGTSPGGLDSIGMTAMGSGANMSFVIALQTIRLLSIVLIGPSIVRTVSHYTRKKMYR